MRLKVLTIISLFTLLTTGVLGIAVMGLALISSHSHCPIAALFGMVAGCPVINTAASMAIHHLEGLRAITLSILVLSLALVVFLAALLMRGGFIDRHKLIYNRCRVVFDFIVKPDDRLTFWSALHNKLDIVASF